MIYRMASRKAWRVAAAILIAVVIMFGEFDVNAVVWGSSSFRIESEDGSKVFIYRPGRSLPRLAVYYNTVPLQLIYTIAETPEHGLLSERCVIISECFQYIVLIPFRSGTVLRFYENGELLRSYALSDLVRHTDASRYAWGIHLWEDVERRTFNSENNRLRIAAIDGIFPFTSTPIGRRAFVFDITTGEIVARSPLMPKPFINIIVGLSVLSSICIHRRRKVRERISAEAHETYLAK